MKIIIANDYDELSKKAAGMVAAFIRGNPLSTLCLAAGDTPLGAYAELIKMQASGAVNLSDVYYAALDEWVGLGPEDKGSCRQVMDDHFYLPAGIPRDRIHVFNGLGDPAAECGAMNKWLAARGGIGLTLLGVGINGHIGFNEPNVKAADGAITVPLDGTTKAVSVKYFGKERPVSAGVTIGLSALLKAREMLVMANGAKKAAVIKRAFYGNVTPAVPASMLQNHPALTLLLDRDAAGMGPSLKPGDISS